MNNFLFQKGTRIVFGGGCVREYLASFLKRYGPSVLLASGGGDYCSGATASTTRSAGLLRAAGKQVGRSVPRSIPRRVLRQRAAGGARAVPGAPCGPDPRRWRRLCAWTAARPSPMAAVCRGDPVGRTSGASAGRGGFAAPAAWALMASPSWGPGLSMALRWLHPTRTGVVRGGTTPNATPEFALLDPAYTRALLPGAAYCQAGFDALSRARWSTTWPRRTG